MKNESAQSVSNNVIYSYVVTILFHFSQSDTIVLGDAIEVSQVLLW